MASSSELEKLERRYAENPDGRFFAPLADAYRKGGQVDRALELVRAGLNKHPDYLSAHIVLGRCLLDKGADTEAAATFLSVLTLDGENIIALKSLAEISERGGRVDEAKEWLQKLLLVDSMNLEAEADLHRLGGAVAAPAKPAEEVAAAAAPETSFADVAAEMRHAPAVAAATAPEPTAEVVAAAPKPEAEPELLPELEPVLEAPPPQSAAAKPQPPLAAIADMPTVPMEALPLAMPETPPPAAGKPDVHPLPSETRVSAEALDVMPFDDSLAWGTGERSSRAVRAEDVQEFVHDKTVIPPAIEFISGIPGAELPEAAPATPAAAPAPPAPPEAQPAAAAPAAGAFDEFTIEPPPDQSLGGLELAPQPENVELPADLSGAYSIVDEVPGAPTFAPPVTAAPSFAPPPPPPPVRPPEPVPQAASADLPLIMPEDVTPPEELSRPSAKMVQMVSPPPREEPAAHPPMATETMGDLYLKQGFRTEAADVYRRLLAQRPADAGLSAKLRAAEGPPPDLSAVSLGAESVGTWLKRVAVSRLSASSAAPVSAPAPPGPAAAPEPSPLEAAFTAESDGEPAHPANDAFSLDQIFGAAGEPAPPPAPPAKAAAPPPPLGASFDEFFGPPASKPAEPAAAPLRPSKLGDEDLTAFSAWLQGLKK